VERGGVGLILEFAEESGFVNGGIGEEGEQLVAMRGEDHAIKTFGRDVGAVRTAGDANNFGVLADAITPRCGEPGDVFLLSAINGPPLVLGGEAKEAVIVEETRRMRAGNWSIFSGGVDHTALPLL